MAKELLKGNNAMAEAAVRAGLEAYFGYPITPQTEILEMLSSRMPELGRVFLQAESELAAVNMAIGAASTGARVMSSSSSPGVSLMLEGVSYLAGMELPLVLIDVMRAGPGLANISPSQSDYNQIVHGGGHGDYHAFALAPATVQEGIDLTVLAFDLAERYRTLSVVLADGAIGQMMEPAELPPMRELATLEPSWALTGAQNRDRRFITSFYLEPGGMETLNLRLQKRWLEAQAREVRFAEYYLDDAKLAVVAFGSAGRIALSAVRAARAKGIPIGLLRPITVKPFPVEALANLSKRIDSFLVVEMNAGQMLDDVERIVAGRSRIEFFGRFGGIMPYPDEILAEIECLASSKEGSGTARERWLKKMFARPELGVHE